MTTGQEPKGVLCRPGRRRQMTGTELHASKLGEDVDSPTCNFAEFPVGFGCRVAGYYFTWTILVATDEVGG